MLSISGRISLAYLFIFTASMKEFLFMVYTDLTTSTSCLTSVSVGNITCDMIIIRSTSFEFIAKATP